MSSELLEASAVIRTPSRRGWLAPPPIPPAPMPIMPARPPLRPSAPVPLALFDCPIVLWKPELRLPPLLLLLPELLPKLEPLLEPPLELLPKPDCPPLLLPDDERRSAADFGAVCPGVSN